MGMLKYIMFIFFITPNFLNAQKEIKLNLAKLQSQGKLITVNRTPSIEKDKKRKYIKALQERGEGFIWLPVEEFSSGKIKIVMRGKDVFQRSFVGVAFHGQNDSTYDAVYCRPFNFLAEDSVRRVHAIEYVAHPQYTWQKLRAEYNGIYEKEIKNPPKPNDWFSMTLVIDEKTVKAYINNNEKPSLEVEKLSQFSKGKLGIFVADNSGGDFEKITILYQKE